MRQTLALLILSTLSGPALAAVSHSFALGADWSSQRYGVLAEDTAYYETPADTTAAETEARFSWSTSLAAGDTNSRLNTTSRLSLGTGSLRTALGAAITRRLAAGLELSAADDADLRLYHRLLPGLADTTGRRDCLDNSLRAELALQPSSATRIAVNTRADLSWYPRPDSYNHNYLTGRAGIDFRRSFGLLSNIDAGITVAQRWTDPDRRWQEIAVRLGLDGWLDPLTVELSADALRRRAADPARSYFELAPALRLDWTVSDAVGLTLDENFRRTRYDSATSAYDDIAENNARLELNFSPVSAWELRLGPGFAIGRSLTAEKQEDYNELALGAGLDFAPGDRFWLALEGRLGVRRFPSADTLVSGNYSFGEMNLALNWSLLRIGPRQLNLAASAAVSPEWHALNTDDFTSRVLSLELTYNP